MPRALRVALAIPIGVAFVILGLVWSIALFVWFFGLPFIVAYEALNGGGKK